MFLMRLLLTNKGGVRDVVDTAILAIITTWDGLRRINEAFDVGESTDLPC